MSDRTPHVFVVQHRPRLDIRPAEEYGEIKLLLPAGDQLYDTDHAVQKMFSNLHRFTERDYLLPIGHPVAIGLAVAMATRMNGGRAKLLLYNPKLERYSSVQIDLSNIQPSKDLRL